MLPTLGILLSTWTSSEAEETISNAPVDIAHQMRNGEKRLVQIGETNAKRVLLVVTTMRGSKTRVVTAFPANRAYHSFMQHRRPITAMAKRILPEFQSEAEEAKWWFDHQDELLEDFKEAASHGALGRGTAARLGGLPTTTIRLDPVDIQMARDQAEKRGLRYQTYLKMILHEALVREAKAT